MVQPQVKNINNYTLLLAIWLCSFGISGAQQIITDTNVTPANLVETLLGENCVEASKINSPNNGDIDGIKSYGYFERGNSNFPFENGILLTSGNAQDAGNSLITDALNVGSNSWGTDPDLNSTLGISNTLNATTLEFEFVSAASVVQFNYILASEEYLQEYPCFYSDGFAILLKEAGSSNPFINIALIPGTNIEVNTTTIHDTIEGFCEASNEAFFDGYNLGDTNYNGRTKVLSANATIKPNVPYIIKFIVADEQNVQFDTAVFIEGNSFNAAVDLGPDINTCASFIELNGDIGNSLSTYEWFKDGALITGETNATLNVTESGNYRVIVNSPLGTAPCIIEDSVSITIQPEQTNEPITDLVLCDDLSNDGVEVFDLNSKLDELLNAVATSNYNVLFFESEEDARSNSSPLNSSYQNINSPQTIYVRMEDIDSGCLAFPEFNLVVNPLPNPVVLSPLIVCQDQQLEDNTPVDLSALDIELTEGNSDLMVSYHSTQNEALDNLNPISSPYNNPNLSETIYARLINTTTGCINTTAVSLEFVPLLPLQLEGNFIDLCLDPSIEFANFDLSTAIPGILNGQTGLSYSYHETYTDALTNNNPIINPTSYQNTTANFQTVYIRFQDDSNQCPTIVPVELHINILDNGFPDALTVTLCDDISNDGTAFFNLDSVIREISRGFLGLDITLYPTLNDLNNQSNALDPNATYLVNNGEATIYALFVSETCTKTIDILLKINDAILITAQVTDYCKVLNDQGETEIVLAELDQAALQGISPGTVRYFLDETNALNNENPLVDSFISNTSTQRFFIRIQSDLTQCSDVTTLDVNIIDTPVISEPTPLTACDEDGDGIELVNLESKISELATDTSDLIIAFHNNFDEAERSINPIINPQNYQTNSTDIFIRTENSMTGCFTIVPLIIYVNSKPEISDVSPLINCESSFETADFILSIKDVEILNGQSDKTVLYFLNEPDAISRSNGIDKDASFQNTTNPQTIYYRIENLTDSNCFSTGTLPLEVRPQPVYNVPADIFVCDDSSSDNMATINLQNTVDAIQAESSDDLTISFHPGMEAAMMRTNPHPLEFTNTVNPEVIFVRIENKFGCYVIEEFALNVVAPPLVNASPELVKCDTDYDGQVSWDLTVVETSVLNIRQDNIAISYFGSMEALESHTNVITDPSNFINTSNPQTAYIKITNTISNCYSTVPIPLQVQLPPATNDFQSYEVCETESGIVDLNDINPIITDLNQSSVAINYYSNTNDATNEMNPLPDSYAYSSLRETLVARVTSNSNGCHIIYPFELIINTGPVPGQISDIEDCDDDFDSMLAVNFSSQTQAILTGLDPNSHTVTYYNSLQNALNDNNALPTTYVATNGEEIIMRLQETITGCFTLVNFFVIVHPRPQLDIPRQTLCSGEDPLMVSAITGLSNETYAWSTGAQTPTIVINDIGLYSVTVTSEFGCETTTEFEVIASEAAFVEMIETGDFTDPNTIRIKVSGTGDYVFQLDDGPFQESGFFENVSLGFHTVTITDLNGCAEVTREVLVIDAPKFFTPNGDGTNDTWHIIGVETLPGTEIVIFDRYGKLLKQMTSDTPGWDGTYLNNNMPASDYWFLATVIKNEETFEVKGHFTLKR